MPLYDYKCEKCGEITTEVRSSELLKEDAKCEKCGGIAKYKFSFGGTISIPEHMKATGEGSGRYIVSDEQIAEMDAKEDKRITDYATERLSKNKVHKKYY